MSHVLSRSNIIYGFSPNRDVFFFFFESSDLNPVRPNLFCDTIKIFSFPDVERKYRDNLVTLKNIKSGWLAGSN